MKRYDPDFYILCRMEPCPDGDWIEYDDHAAFVERVREIAENMPHDPECESLIEEWVDRPGHIGFMFPYKCGCRRGKLLELCEEAK